jgi:hypothetical protein
MLIKGYVAFIVTFAVVLLLFSSLGLFGSIDVSVGQLGLEILFLIGLAILLLAILLRRRLV